MIRGLSVFTLLACGLLLACAGAASVTPADLILTNGKIVTVEPTNPEVQALAARDGLVLAVGTNEEIARFSGADTELIDLDGRLAIPGFIESHAHFAGIGRALLEIDLRSARSWAEVVERVAAAAGERAEDEWILGWGWHQEKWGSPPDPHVEGYPTHELLSRAVPHHPVLLKHAAGSHAGIVNARALALAGIDASTPDPPGGEILRDERGRATGVLRETAYALALEAQQSAEAALGDERREARATRELELADRECLSKGITSFQDAGSSFDTVDRVLRLAERGALGVRLWLMLREDNDALEARIADYPLIGAANDHVTVRAIKRSIDGALGPHGAWLLDDYSDLPGSEGLNTIPLDELEQTARLALGGGLQLCVHAIGDRANRETLDLYERVLGDRGPELRWRIEHAQHLHPDDIPRFARLGVVASMQGVHCTSDGPWVPTRLGDERSAAGAYVWRKLIDSGALVANGTDAPVEDVDPIKNFHASVTRRLGDGTLFYPQQRMTRFEALESYSLNAARAAFEDEIKGTLAPGKLADITVLSQDILEVPDEQILDTKVELTIVGGEVKYRLPGNQRRTQ